MSGGVKSVTWALTNRCNYKCAHCYVSAPNCVQDELDTAAAFAIIDMLYSSGVRRVALTGGEPLIRSDFFKIAKRLSERSITISQIATNGSLINESLLIELISLGQRPRISISYDGDDGAHDALRGVNGASAAALDAFSLCKAYGLETASEITLHSQNANVLRKSIITLAAHGCKSVKALPIFPVGAAAKSDAFAPLSPKALYSLFLSYISDYYADGMPVELFLHGFFYASSNLHGFAVPMERFCGDERALSCAYCAHAALEPYLSADGRLLPCACLAGFTQLVSRFPLVLRTGVDAAIKSEAFGEFLEHTVKKQLQSPQCGACAHRFVCGGGCRIAPLSSGKGMLGPDIFCCEFFNGGWKERIIEAVRLGKLNAALTRRASPADGA